MIHVDAVQLNRKPMQVVSQLPKSVCSPPGGMARLILVCEFLRNAAVSCIVEKKVDFAGDLPGFGD
jgi:hypothetical protein